MSDTVNNTAQVKFNNNVEMVLQQTKSELEWAVETTDDTGADRIKVKDLTTGTKPQEADERHGDLKQTNVQHDGVWLNKPNELYFLEYVDGADELATTIGLEGEYTQQAVATINRSRDDRILQGIYGPIISGKEATIVNPFPAGQIVPVGVGGTTGPQRLNVAKVREAKKMLGKAFVDKSEMRFMALSEEQLDDLHSEVQATSSDFQKAFGAVYGENGVLLRLLGFTLIPFELRNPLLKAYSDWGLTVDPNGYTKNPFWVKSGVRLNYWRRLRTAIKDQPSKVDTKSVFAGMTGAATRTQAGKVGFILNSEAA